MPMFVCIYTMCVYVSEHATAPLWFRGHFCGFVLFFHLYLASVGWTRATRHESKCFFLLIHLQSSK